MVISKYAYHQLTKRGRFMKKILKAAKWVGAVSASAGVVVSVPLSIKFIGGYGALRDTVLVNSAEEKAKTDESQRVLVNILESKTINSKTLAKNLKMNFQLCRGGTFDFSKTNLLNRAKKVTYDEVIDFIDNASLSELIMLREQFTEIEFNKTFSVKFNELLTVKSLISSNQTTLSKDVIDQIKTALVTENIDYLYNDFSFVAGDARYDEKVVSTLFDSSDNFYSYIKWDDSTGKRYSTDEVKGKISSITTEQELKDFLSNGPQEPVFVFKLVDDYVIKTKNVVELNSKPKYGTKNADENIDIEFGKDFDDLFGYKTSLYDYEWFTAAYAWKNVISPMLQIKFKKISDQLWRDASDHVDKVVFEEENDSILYSRRFSLEDVLSYTSDKSSYLKSSVPLATRVFENKLKSSQTANHGVTLFSPPDALKEAYTRDWYPTTSGTFQNMWQYLNYYVAWGNQFTIPSPGEINTAHKNGVRALATLYNDQPSTLGMRIMAMSENDKMVFIENLVKILKDRGADGIFWNAEMGSWKTSGMTYAGWKHYSDFLHILDTRFKAENLTFMQYANEDVEVPLDFDKKKQAIEQGANDDGTIDGLWDRTENDYRRLHTSPARGTFSFNHFAYDFSKIDDEFGIGAGKYIFNGFVDKGDLMNDVASRIKFVNEHPDYTLNVMGWDDNSNTVDWLNKEWEAMQTLKNDQGMVSAMNVPQSAFDEFYGDYTIYGDRSHAAFNDLDFAMSEFISRGAYAQKDSTVQTDFHLTKFQQEQMATNNGFKPFQVSYWERNGQDPRATTKAISDYFQERSTINNDDFSTSFEGGYGHQFNVDANKIYDTWSNVGMQDIMPTYRYIIDKYDAKGKLVDDSVNNYLKRDITAKLFETNDAYYGNDVLAYDGELQSNESFINKLYVSEITENKEFSLIVKDDNSNKNDVSLAVWRNKGIDAKPLSPKSSTSLANGYVKYTFDVSASATDKITSFGLKFKNSSAAKTDLSKIYVDGLSFSSNKPKTHNLTNFTASTNNFLTEGVNVKFEDSGFDVNTRYLIYDESCKKLYDIESSPFFHVDSPGVYKIVAQDNLGNELTSRTVSLNAKEGDA